MRAIWTVGFAILLLIAGGAVPAVADFNLTFDESGNAFYSLNGGPVVALAGIVGPDPTLGVTGDVLIYALPDLVNLGDVRIWEDHVGGTLSDMLRFANGSDYGQTSSGFTHTGTTMIYYSDVEPGSTDTGINTGFPSATAFNDFGTGIVEDASGNFDWLPGSNEYRGFSDGTIVPEPSSLVLLGTVCTAAMWIIRRRQPKRG